MAEIALLAVVLAGCASLFGRPDDEFAFEEDRIFVRVINDNFYDVTVYTDLDGHRTRLGRVTGNRTEIFALPGHVGGTTLAVVIAVQAGRSFRTNRITLWPGEETRVNVPPDLDRRSRM